MNTITFSSTKIAGFRRADGSAGVVRFQSNVNGYEELFSKLGWSLPEVHCSFKRFDTILRGGHFVLSSTAKLIDEDVDIEFTEISGFECHRVGSRKNTKRVLRFKASFKCQDGAANLETYMVRTDNARGSLKVVYLREPVQQEIPETQMAMVD